MPALLRRCAVALAIVMLLPTGASASAVDDLRTEVDRTARELTEGTRLLEREQFELAAVQRRLATARREASAASAESDQARERLRAVVSAAYRRPLAEGMVLALSGGADGFGRAVAAQADLARVRGRQQDLLQRASTGRVRAAGAVRSVEQLTEEAARRTRDVADRTAALRATADRTANRLKAAMAEQARQQARQRAVATARAAAASRFRAAATCGGGRGDGPNGFLDPSSLCPLVGASGALRADAAASFARMSAAHRADRGDGLCVTDSYRPYAAQVDVFRRKPRLAAVPGTSRHGLGVALDLGCGAERFGSASYRWLKANAGTYGWVHPSWAEPGGATPEPWHWEYVG